VFGTEEVKSAEVLNPDECQHNRTETRRLINSAGAPMFKLQCLDCGAGVGEWIAKNKIRNFGGVLHWDRELQQAGERAREAAFQSRRRRAVEDQENRTSEWWLKYAAYLRSPEWAYKSKLVLQRDKYECQARYIGCSGRANQAHHLTYKHAFNEPLFDLVSVCERCHQKITEMDKEQRVGA
jgi:5-methylcytosine-specific restriction endonuclease McrA